jgi:hypothetical protein
MFVNKVKINISTLGSNSTAFTVNFPLFHNNHIVDNSELIEREFVNKEIENAINPILDYDRVRFIPLSLNDNNINKIIYDIRLFDENGNYSDFYSAIGFTDDDLKFKKNSFKKTFLNLSFFDSDNPLTQKLVTNLTLFANLNPNDYIPINSGTISSNTVIPGTPKPASQVSINFVVENPLLNPNGLSEGFHLYDYKDELKIGESKYLYMRASFKNAKTGKAVNLMVKDAAQPIDKLVHELYTRYILTRTSQGYYYKLDETYQGNLNVIGSNNVIYNNNSVTVMLYQIKAT